MQWIFHFQPFACILVRNWKGFNSSIIVKWRSFLQMNCHEWVCSSFFSLTHTHTHFHTPQFVCNSSNLPNLFVCWLEWLSLHASNWSPMLAFYLHWRKMGNRRCCRFCPYLIGSTSPFFAFNTLPNVGCLFKLRYRSARCLTRRLTRRPSCPDPFLSFFCFNSAKVGANIILEKMASAFRNQFLFVALSSNSVRDDISTSLNFGKKSWPTVFNIRSQLVCLFICPLVCMSSNHRLVFSSSH